jgi:hypothetical protein
MPVIIRLIELREYLTHRLYKLHWRKCFSLAVQVAHEVFGCLSEQNAWIVSQLSGCVIQLKIFDAIFEFIDSFEALHHTIHIACVPKVL